MNFNPLGDRVAIKLVPQEEKSSGGIIIPDAAKEKPMKGEIVAVGKGLRNKTGEYQSLEVKVGDIVLFGKWAGNEVKVNGEDLMIMKESDIMGIIN